MRDVEKGQRVTVWNEVHAYYSRPGYYAHGVSLAPGQVATVTHPKSVPVRGRGYRVVLEWFVGGVHYQCATVAANLRGALCA